MKWLGKINAADGEQRELYRKMFARELEELDAVYSTAYRKIFANVSDLSKAGMEEALALARGRLSKLISEGADVADIDAMSNRVNELQRAIDEFSFTGWDAGVEAVTESIHGLIAARNRLKNAQTAEVKDLNEIAAATEAAARAAEDMRKSIRATAVNSLLSAVSKIGDSMREIAEISGDEGLAEAGEMIAGFADTFGGSIEALARGDMIGAAVSAVTGVIDATVDAFVSYRKANEQFKRNNEMFRQSLEIMAVQINERDYEGMFGDRAARKAVDAFGAARKAMTQFASRATSMRGVVQGRTTHGGRTCGAGRTRTTFRTGHLGEDGCSTPPRRRRSSKRGTTRRQTSRRSRSRTRSSCGKRTRGLSVVEGYVGDLLGGLGDNITDTSGTRSSAARRPGSTTSGHQGQAARDRQEHHQGVRGRDVPRTVQGQAAGRVRHRRRLDKAPEPCRDTERDHAEHPDAHRTAKAAVDSVLPASGYSVADFAESSRSAVAKSGFAASQNSVDETNGLLTVQNSMLSEVRTARESRSAALPHARLDERHTVPRDRDSRRHGVHQLPLRGDQGVPEGDEGGRGVDGHEGGEGAMIGGVLINGSDIFLAYGAFLADGGFAGLAKWPPVKKVDYNDWQEYDGIEPDLSDIRLDSVTFPLTFCVGARGGGAGALEDFYALLCSGPTLTLSHGGLGREFALRLVGISDLAYAMRFSRVTATFANDDFMAGYSYAPPVPLAVTDGSVEIDSTPVSAYGMRALAGTEDTRCGTRT